MKVSELIERLKKEDPEAVVTFENLFHGVGAEVTSVTSDDEGNVVIK